MLKDYKLDDSSDDKYIDASEALSDLHKKTTQSAIASMELAKRPISYKMAQKLAKLFDTFAEAFLEN